MNSLLLERRYPGATTCIVVGENATSAADLGEFRHVLWVVDGERTGRGATNGGRTILRVEPGSDAMAGAVEQFVRTNGKHLPSLLVTRDVLANATERYADSLQQIAAILDVHHRARMTRQKDGYTWQDHLFRNLRGYAACRMPAQWQGALRGLPAFVCGAGPSLDVSAPVLGRHAAHGIVLSADSALRALARHGIAADFAVSIDQAKVPEKCLPPNEASPRVILSAVSPPGWQSAAPGRCFFLSSGQVTLDWLAQQGLERTAISANENCGSTALTLAVFLGCSPIYLFGMDLALDAVDPARRHNASADPGIYVESGFNASNAHPMIPGNYTERVPTFAVADWRALDERIATWPPGTVINVNDRGARFRGATLVHPHELKFAHDRRDKHAALAQLAPASGCSETDAAALSRLANIGRAAAKAVEPVRDALKAHGPAGAAAAFRSVLAASDMTHAFGAFSFKLMPHLIPPIEGDDAFWAELIEEFHRLAKRAAEL